MVTVKVGRRGQITIPSEIRHLIGLKEGHSLAIIQDGQQLILQPITETLLDLRGSVHVEAPQDFDKIRAEVITTRGKRLSW